MFWDRGFRLALLHGLLLGFHEVGRALVLGLLGVLGLRAKGSIQE